MDAKEQARDVMADEGTAENTDREIWREREGDFYADSIHVTQGGGIGINCGGHVIVRPVRDWHKMACIALEKEKPRMPNIDSDERPSNEMWGRAQTALIGSHEKWALSWAGKQKVSRIAFALHAAYDEGLRAGMAIADDVDINELDDSIPSAPSPAPARDATVPATDQD